MRGAILFLSLLCACGRSGLSDPATEPIPPAPATPTAQPEPAPPATPSPLLGHWAEFHLGNCINDEAWLSFAEGGQLTVTSVDRNYCGPHSVAAAQGTFVAGQDALQLSWVPAGGARALEVSYAVLPRSGVADWSPESYRFGNRELSMRAWSGSDARHTRLWVERYEESGKLYARDSRGEVSFDASVLDAAVGSTVTATLKWTSTIDWGDAPRRTLAETFELPCRVTLEDGERHVRAVVLDQYDGFWKLLTARGLDRSYGWDLDRLVHAFGPDWTVDAAGRLFQRRSYAAPAYLELQHPPPAQL